MSSTSSTSSSSTLATRPDALTNGEQRLFQPAPSASPVGRWCHAKIRALPPARVLIVGDSHVAFLTRPGYGLEAARRDLAPLNVAAHGGPGDTTAQLHHRLDAGEFDAYDGRDVRPALLVVALGANMLGDWCRPAVAALAIVDAVQRLRARVGPVGVLLHAVLPPLVEPDAWHALRIPLNHALGDAAYARGWGWFNPAPHFAGCGTVPLFQPRETPAVHLSPRGYAVWCGLLAARIASEIRRPYANRPRLVGVSPWAWRALDVARTLRDRVRDRMPE